MTAPACDKETVADAASISKRERNKEKKKEEEEEEEEEKKEEKASERFATPCKFDDRSYDRVQPITSIPRTMIVSMIESLEKVFETMDDSLITKVQNQLPTSEDRCKVWSRWVKRRVRGEREINRRVDIDYVYVYLHKD